MAHAAIAGQALGTGYTALAMHRDEAGRQQLEAMGFRDGWGKALDQLVAHVKSLRARRPPLLAGARARASRGAAKSTKARTLAASRRLCG